MKHYGIHDARVHLAKLPTFQTNNSKNCVMADSRMREREEHEARRQKQKRERNKLELERKTREREMTFNKQCKALLAMYEAIEHPAVNKYTADDNCSIPKVGDVFDDSLST